MTEYGYLESGDARIPAEMRIVTGLIPYYTGEHGEVCPIWPMGYYEGREQMDENIRKYTWRLQQNANDMKANAFQLIGGISDDHAKRLRDILTEIDTLVAEIRKE